MPHAYPPSVECINPKASRLREVFVRLSVRLNVKMSVTQAVTCTSKLGVIILPVTLRVFFLSLSMCKSLVCEAARAERVPEGFASLSLAVR
jgi:hypothetical protein